MREWSLVSGRKAGMVILRIGIAIAHRIRDDAGSALQKGFRAPFLLQMPNNNANCVPHVRHGVSLLRACRVLRCTKRYAHDWRSCPFAHPTENARRRDPREFRYCAVACPDYKQVCLCARSPKTPHPRSACTAMAPCALLSPPSDSRTPRGVRGGGAPSLTGPLHTCLCLRAQHACAVCRACVKGDAGRQHRPPAS